LLLHVLENTSNSFSPNYLFVLTGSPGAKIVRSEKISLEVRQCRDLLEDEGNEVRPSASLGSYCSPRSCSSSGQVQSTSSRLWVYGEKAVISMRRGSDIIGKPLVSLASGKKFRGIRDVLFDQEENRLLGFLIHEGGWFSDAQFVPLGNVHAIGPDALVIKSADAVVRANRVPHISSILARNNVLKGTRMMTTDGYYLGTIVDLYYDDDGRIEGYDVSGGILADIYNGRSFVPAPKTLRIGRDIAFVPPDTLNFLEEQVGGVRAAAARVAEDVREKSRVAAGRARETTLVASQRLKAAGEDLAAKQAIDQAMGRRAREMVRTDNGVVIVAEGQVVGEDVIERAHAHNRERDVLIAVGLIPREAAADKAREAGAAAKASVRSAALDAKSAADVAWDRLREIFGGLKDSGTKRWEEDRIKRAVGRPVTRVILNRHDEVILSPGEIITYQAIEVARAASVLDVLLDSVNYTKPEVRPEQVRVPEAGYGSLESHRTSHENTRDSMHIETPVRGSQT
jgi:uncharacterized protein YrrD